MKQYHQNKPAPSKAAITSHPTPPARTEVVR
jgi:hypothetical protein